MNSNNTILQELSELNSQLAGSVAQTPYTLPAGYFDGLADQMVRRIKALEAVNAADEIGYLSPLLSGLFKQNLYTVPAGYFEDIEESAAFVASGTTELSAKDELATISPLLSGLKKTNPYTIPGGYFEQLNSNPSVEKNKPAAKVVSMSSRKWWRLAAAAAIVGVIVMAGFKFIGKKDSSGQIVKRIDKEIKKASDKDLNEFLEYTSDDAGTAIVNTDDTKELLKDIPENELKDFLQETSDIDVNEENSKMN
jgi:hypothetical protein